MKRTKDRSSPASADKPLSGEALIADDNSSIRGVLRVLLEKAGLEVTETEDGVQAIECLRARPFDLVITDLLMPNAGGLEVLRACCERPSNTPVIMLTAAGSIRECAEVMRLGAFNFLTKPFHPTELEECVRQALRTRAPRAPQPDEAGGDQPQIALIGHSQAMRDVIDVIERVAAADSTVLLTGESGTGKEVIARLLHGSSPRAGQPFVAVNCGAIPETLIESELFGHAKGSFTGASEERVGRFVQANGGTLFLDEIGELPFPLQVKLLRVLQDREVMPVGASRSRVVDLRIVAATNRNLEEMVESGAFRRDLYYRLDVLSIHLPALRERPDDIPALARHFLELMNRRFGRDVKLSEDALTLLMLYGWPGNVREMENLFERLVVLDRTGLITTAELPARLREGGSLSDAAALATRLAKGAIDLPAAVAAVESALIDQALRQAGGNRTHAAQLLSLSRSTLLDKMRRHGTVAGGSLHLVAND
jgi:DNA-binding NtrC family response regulator